MTSAETVPVDTSPDAGLALRAAESDRELDLTDHASPVVPRQWGSPTIIQVGIVDEHEMFALGLKTCLAGSALVKVSPVVDEDVDVVIVSPQVAEERRFTCPLVVCGDPPSRLAPGNEVMAVLGRGTLTAEQLLASIHAAAAGLRVIHSDNLPASRLAGRGLEVLALLAAGADTKEIAEQLGYSDRTIKSVIRDVQLSLGAKNRVQAVAEGIRQGLI
ncbi:MAG TPA: helix-turn-helix transcriptional regulator [Acidimicrobiia bacterium]|nr:helix-turn-helix transcriptional regulator [Acidimicrobiia bacterium]